MKPDMALAALLIAIASLCTGCARSSEKGPANTIELSVTENGFEPANATVRKGQPVNLVITRRTDKTCATEFIIDEHNINAMLPLNQAVTVTFTPTASGELRYGCGMQKMIGGVLSVQ